MNTYTFKASVLLASVILLPGYAAACASCGCTLSSDWQNMGTSDEPGLRMDLRYDYLNQNQLRSGTGTISPSAASQIVNNGNPQEVEKYTKNQYLTLGADYSFNSAWGVNLQLPYIQRTHSTLGTASDGITAGTGGGQYDSSTSSIGDIKLVGRYQGLVSEHHIGLMLGLKLPTGSYTRTGNSTDPDAPGAAPIDRGLQPGTGTTDAIIGIFSSGQLNHDWSYFVQAMYQAALNSRDEYRPGNGSNLNFGLRYEGFEGVTPLVQINARHVAHDTGANADTTSTGGNLVYVSPGAVVPLSRQLSVYGFVQLPAYQNVRGVQLAPKFTASAGVRYAF